MRKTKLKRIKTSKKTTVRYSITVPQMMTFEFKNKKELDAFKRLLSEQGILNYLECSYD